MKRVSFILAVFGIIVLAGILFFGYSDVSGMGDIEKMKLNSKVVLSGEIESERDFDGFKILGVNGIDLVCECEGFYLGREVRIKGFVDEYEGRKQVRILEIILMSGLVQIS